MEEKESVDVLKDGYRLVPLCFTPLQGRKMMSVIDKKGRVFRPHPYDIPQEPLKVLAFALNHILTVIDTGLVTVGSAKGLFLTEKDLLNYWAITRDFLRALECKSISGQDIEYQSFR